MIPKQYYYALPDKAHIPEQKTSHCLSPRRCTEKNVKSYFRNLPRTIILLERIDFSSLFDMPFKNIERCRFSIKVSLTKESISSKLAQNVNLLICLDSFSNDQHPKIFCN